jgi:hypothetical protein
MTTKKSRLLDRLLVVMAENPAPLRMSVKDDGVRIVAPSLGLDVTGKHPDAAQAAATAHAETLTAAWASSLDESASEAALDALREVWNWTPGIVRAALAVAAWRVTNRWPVRSDHWVTMRDKADGDDKRAVAAVQADAFAEGLVT